MWTFFICVMCSVSVAIVLLLRRFCHKTVPYIVRAVTAYAWLVSMSIVVLVPIDVYFTLKRNQGTNDTIIFIFWAWAYWSTQILTWLLLPFFMIYSDAGDFTIAGRCLTSLKENGILYGTAGLCCGIGVVILLIRHMATLNGLMAVSMTCSNCFGFLATTMMLGYGLVEVPRTLWRSHPETQLKWCAHRAGKYGEQVLKTTEELDKVVLIILANQKQMRRHDKLKPYMDLIANYCEKESPVKPSDLTSRGADVESVRSEDLEYNYDESGLADLRRRMHRAIHRYQAARAQYEEVITHAFELEDIIKARQNHMYEPPSVQPKYPWLSKMVWKYKCLVHPIWGKVCSILLTGLTLVIVWCCISIAIPHPDLSPLSHLLHVGHPGEVSTQLIVLLPLVYVCACTYYALFSISIFDYNKLVPRATAGSSLMQNGSLMCRFVAPVAWNYFHMIHMNKDIDGEKPAFSYLMGNMDSVLPWFSTNVNKYVPTVLVLYCTLVATGLWDRMLSACVSEKYRFTSDNVDDEYTEKGRNLITGERQCVASGCAVGSMLQGGGVEYDGGASHKKAAPSRTWFWGSRTASKPAAAPAASSLRDKPSTGGLYSSSASAAASKWLGRSGSPPKSDVGEYTAMPSSSTTTIASFARPTTQPDASSGSRLDGIFADLSAATFGRKKKAEGDERTPMLPTRKK